MNPKQNKQLYWQLPFLALLIVGTVLIIRQQHATPYQKCAGGIFGTSYHIIYQYDDDLQAEIEAKMKEVDAIIGGDGNGGVIYPECHYGRDALVGIALFLSSLAQRQCTISQLRATFPDYQIAKNSIDLNPDTDVDAILKKVKDRFSKDKSAHISETDGLKIDFPDRWVHLRKSNTEPVVRVYSEAQSIEQADNLGNELMHFFYDMQKDLVLKKFGLNNNLISHNFRTSQAL